MILWSICLIQYPYHYRHVTATHFISCRENMANSDQIFTEYSDAIESLEEERKKKGFLSDLTWHYFDLCGFASFGFCKIKY
ncbi:hypothetical protein llap_4839 [Limosa lapponica baueri]|uniref:Uncharacterized protein n=1 Tax=Limosa lapponica baueri TaxID=1758121 RepID=A0A2I0UFR1_LIMLA|nr:hypothetical protein llap_4839 [Limosa lapponica baueri]